MLAQIPGLGIISPILDPQIHVALQLDQDLNLDQTFGFTVSVPNNTGFQLALGNNSNTYGGMYDIYSFSLR
jgi:hypothetical protein